MQRSVLAWFISSVFTTSVFAQQPDTIKPLSSDEDEIERIQITGQVMTQPARLDVSAKEIRQPLPAQDGADFLRSVTGFSLVRKGGSSGDPVFRGMGGSRVGILTDGDMLLGGCSNRMDPPTAYISPQAFDRVVVIKGPQSVIDGPVNNGATVRFERDWRTPYMPGLHGQTNLTAASFGRVDSNIELVTADTPGYLRFNLNTARADNYQDGDGKNVHSAYRRWNSQLTAAWTPDQHRVIAVSAGLSDGEAAYADRGVDGSRFRRENLSLRFLHHEMNSLIQLFEAQLYYNYADHVMDNYSLRRFIPGMMEHPAAMNPDRRTVGARMRVTLELLPQWELITGVDGQSNQHRDRSSMNQTEMPYQMMPRGKDADFTQTGLFAESVYQFEPDVRWINGLRADRWQVRDLRATLGGGHGHSEHGMGNPTYREQRNQTLFGAFSRYERDFADSTWYIGAGYAERFPDYWELIGGNRQGEDFTNAFYTPVEKTTQIDSGVIWSTQLAGQPLSSSLSVFYGHTDNYILLQQQRMGMHTSTGVRAVDARHYGFEWDSRYSLTDTLQWQASIAYSRGINRTDGMALAQQPPLEGRFGLNWKSGNWQAGSLWRVVDSQHRVAPDQGTIAGLDIGPTAGFATFALNAGWRSESGLRIDGGIDNLFDRTYAEHLSRSGADIPGYLPIARVSEPGRVIWAALSYRL